MVFQGKIKTAYNKKYNAFGTCRQGRNSANNKDDSNK
jgi:hypothetical protein